MELSSCNSSFLTARSGMLNANLFCAMLLIDAYSNDVTLSFKHVTSWSTISKFFSFSFQNLFSACKNDIFDVYPVVTVTIKLLEGFVYLKTSVAFLTAQLSNATIFTGSSLFSVKRQCTRLLKIICINLHFWTHCLIIRWRSWKINQNTRAKYSAYNS